MATSLRALFGYRWAFRSSTEASSDTILGHGWAKDGYSATTIDPAARGGGYAPKAAEITIVSAKKPMEALFSRDEKAD